MANDGSDATFDAELSFYNVGAPVGSQIGGSFPVTNISIASNTSQTVTFPDLGGLAVPQDVIAILSVGNVSAGGDIGVNLFDPPTVGTSDNSFYIVNDGTGFAQASTNLNIDNVYFEILETNTVPEPATAGATFALLVLLAYYKNRRTGAGIG